LAAAGFHGAEFGAEPGGGTGDGDNPGLEGGERVKGLRESNVHYSGLPGHPPGCWAYIGQNEFLFDCHGEDSLAKELVRSRSGRIRERKSNA